MFKTFPTWCHGSSQEYHTSCPFDHDVWKISLKNGSCGTIVWYYSVQCLEASRSWEIVNIHTFKTFPTWCHKSSQEYHTSCPFNHDVWKISLKNGSCGAIVWFYSVQCLEASKLLETIKYTRSRPSQHDVTDPAKNIIHHVHSIMMF